MQHSKEKAIYDIGVLPSHDSTLKIRMSISLAHLHHVPQDRAALLPHEACETCSYRCRAVTNSACGAHTEHMLTGNPQQSILCSRTASCTRTLTRRTLLPSGACCRLPSASSLLPASYLESKKLNDPCTGRYVLGSGAPLPPKHHKANLSASLLTTLLLGYTYPVDVPMCDPCHRFVFTQTPS